MQENAAQFLESTRDELKSHRSQLVREVKSELGQLRDDMPTLI